MRRRVLLAVFLLALALRLLHVFQLHTAPVFDMRLGDSAVYDRWAREIAAGDWIGQGVFWYAPLYPYLLGAVYAAFGTGPLAVRLLQAGLGAASCAVLAWAAARLFAPRAGIAAGLLLAVFAPAIFYDALLHRPVLELFLMSVVVAVVSAGSGRTASPRFAAALGVASGLLVLARENTLSFVPLFALLLLVRPWAGGRGRTIPALVYVLAVALVLSPVALRNRLVGGELHLTAANFGDNFYKGNHPGADGWYVPLRPSRGTPALERADATALAERELGRALSPSEISRYWTGRALQFIRSHPGDWLRLLAKKTFLVWHRTELGDTEDLYTFATWSDVLRATNRFAHFGLLAPLGLLGLWVTARRARTLWPLYAMLVIYPASVVLFYVFGRYRYPVVAVLVPFAGAAITESASFFRAAGALKRIACVLSVVAALVACNWPTGAEERVRAATLHNIGVWLARTPEQAAQAIGYYEQALRLEPHSALTLYDLGNALRMRGALEKAEERYREAIALEACLAVAHNNLGQCLEARGRPLEAIAAYRRAIECDREAWEAWNNLGLALGRAGRVDEAVDALHEALSKGPDGAMFHFNLGNVLLQGGRTTDAEAEYRKAVALDPRDPKAHNNLALALASLGRVEEAIASYSEALRLDPGYTDARNSLAALEAGERPAPRQ